MNSGGGPSGVLPMSTRRWASFRLSLSRTGGDEIVVMLEEPDGVVNDCPDGVKASVSLGSIVFLSSSGRIIFSESVPVERDEYLDYLDLSSLTFV